MRDLNSVLEQRKAAALYRQPKVVSGVQQPEMVVNGKPLLNFCSNDYLGLASNDQVRKAFKLGIDRYGAGSGAAHLVTGHSAAHQALEEELAEFTGRESALLFSSGYQANLGIITTLVGRGDTVLEDRLNHASLIDGGLLSGARFVRYPHGDVKAAGIKLEQAKGEKLLVTDGVFSMDGDQADLPLLAASCKENDAWLMVDDAHGMGVLGEAGAGSIAHFGLGQDDVPVLMGTLGKAFGTAGAFVAGSKALIETLIQQARSYIYTTALPAAVAEATRQSLQLVKQDEWRRQRLRELVRNFRREASALGFQLSDSTTPIQPLIAGSSERALAWSVVLQRQGVLVAPIRPPTVPEGTARLRVTFSAIHTDEQLARLLEALEIIKKEEAGAA